MTRYPIAVVAVMAATLVLLTSCASPREGNASPQSATSSYRGSSGGVAGLDLSNVDPCELLTKKQRAELHIGKVVNKSEDPALKAPTCSFRWAGTSALDVTVDTHHSIDMWKRNVVPKQSVTVGGFRSWKLTPTKSECWFVVGVRSGQQLKVRNRVTADKSYDKHICSTVKQWAKAALQTLRTLQ